MKVNTAKQRMLAGQPAFGASIVLGAPLAGEFMSQAGFDFVLIDNQHGAFDDTTVMWAIRSVYQGPAIPMVRVMQNDYYAIGRLLDRGALGIVVPMVNSVADAREAARAMRYPPRGERSLGIMGSRFLGPDYEQRVDDELFLAIQIENPQAVERAEEILAVEGVDGCWIGPGDLAKTMGVDVRTPEGYQAHEAMILRVLDACHKTGKIPGIAGGSAADAQRWASKGFLFLTAFVDSAALVSVGQACLRDLGRL